jgi:hypothetical protein
MLQSYCNFKSKQSGRKKLWVIPWQEKRGRHVTVWKYNFKVLDANILLLIIDPVYGIRRPLL